MKKALVVDDTKNIRTLLTTCLELNGYSVINANNGQEAIEIFKNEKIDLAFLDIKMPKLSGTEVLRTIRAMGIDTPVVIMTAFATVKNAVECTKLGAVSYLQKPFTADKIKSLIKEIFEGEKNKDNVSNYIETARNLILQEKTEDALKILKKALSHNPCNGEIYYLLGKVHEKSSELELSKKFFKIAAEFGYKE
jgi:two-component system OmpR family response regulator